CTVPWNFEEDTIQGAAVLYAGWTEEESEEADPSLTDGDNSIENAGNPEEAADAESDENGIFVDSDAAAEAAGEGGYGETTDNTGISADADVTGVTETSDVGLPEFLKDLHDKADASDRIKDADTPAAHENEELSDAVDLEITLPAFANGMTGEDIKGAVETNCEDMEFSTYLYSSDLDSMSCYLKGVSGWLLFYGETSHEISSVTINEEEIPVVFSWDDFDEAVYVEKRSCCLSESGYLEVFYNIYEEAAPCSVSVDLPAFTDGMTAAQAGAGTVISPSLTDLSFMFSDDGTTESENAYVPGQTGWFIFEGTPSAMPTSVLLNGESIPIVYGSGFLAENQKEEYRNTGISYAYYELEDGNAVFGVCADAFYHEPGTGPAVSVTINGDVTKYITVEEAAARVSLSPEQFSIGGNMFLDAYGYQYDAYEPNTRYFLTAVVMEEEPVSVSLNGKILPVPENESRRQYYLLNGEEDFAFYDQEANTLFIYEYVADVVPTCYVYVEDSSEWEDGTGYHFIGDTVTIKAGTKSLQRFTGWTTEDSGVFFEDASAATTTLVVPDDFYIRVTANWEAKLSTITFDPTGGTVETTTAETTEYGELDELPVPEPADASLYEFVGWYTEITGGEYVDEDIYFEEDTTIYARWNIRKLEINGLDIPTWGESPDHIVSVPEGSFYRLMTPQEIPEYDTYTASDSYSAEDGEGGVVWRKTKDYSSSLMKSTETFDADFRYYMRAYVVVTEPGYVFYRGIYPTILINGGSYLAVNGYRYSDSLQQRHFVESREFEITEPDGIQTVTFDPNGGTLEGISQTSVQTGENGRLSSLPTPENGTAYSFDGWYTQRSGGTKVFLNTVYNAETTLYAHWIISSAEVSGYTEPVWGENPDFALEIPEDAHCHFASYDELEEVKWSSRVWAVNGVFWYHYDYGN
ncbi:MAG: InlB B-repeat-containing protein, partial [Eubacterium sp.]|nr:InlB B-repeat-containing protein [Eubacterium sp.]